MHVVMTCKLINNLAWLLDDQNPLRSRLEHHQTRIPLIMTARQKALSRIPCWTPVVGSGNTAEPSGEVSVGDMVVVGEAALIVARAGFVPLTGSFTPVHVHEHGTHPIG
jgi:hypothetical protein